MKEGWEKKKLGDIAEIISGKNQKKVENPSGKYPICGSGGIMGYADEYLCPAGTTIIGRKGTINKPLYIDTPFWNVDTAFGISPNKEHNSRFVFYLCKKIDWLKYNKSTTLPSLVKTDIQNITIPVPPLSVQESIVSELDMLSGIISKHKALQEEYDRLEQSIFYDMFGDPITNEKGWEVKKLEDVCTHIIDCPHSTPVKAERITIYPCIRTSELKNGSIFWDSMQYLEKEEFEKRIARLRPMAGDIVFGREGTIGDAVILPEGYNFCLGQRTMLIRVDDNIINNIFIHRVILSEWIKMQIRAVNVSSTVAHVNVKDFKQFNIPLPPLSLQQSFADKISAIEQMKAKNKAAQEEAEMLFNERMAYYF